MRNKRDERERRGRDRLNVGETGDGDNIDPRKETLRLQILPKRLGLLVGAPRSVFRHDPPCRLECVRELGGFGGQARGLWAQSLVFVSVFYHSLVANV